MRPDRQLWQEGFDQPRKRNSDLANAAEAEVPVVEIGSVSVASNVDFLGFTTGAKGNGSDEAAVEGLVMRAWYGAGRIV